MRERPNPETFPIRMLVGGVYGNTHLTVVYELPDGKTAFAYFTMNDDNKNDLKVLHFIPDSEEETIELIRAKSIWESDEIIRINLHGGHHL